MATENVSGLARGRGGGGTLPGTARANKLLHCFSLASH